MSQAGARRRRLVVLVALAVPVLLGAGATPRSGMFELSPHGVPQRGSEADGALARVIGGPVTLGKRW